MKNIYTKDSVIAGSCIGIIELVPEGVSVGFASGQSEVYAAQSEEGAQLISELVSPTFAVDFCLGNAKVSADLLERATVQPEVLGDSNNHCKPKGTAFYWRNGRRYWSSDASLAARLSSAARKSEGV